MVSLDNLVEELINLEGLVAAEDKMSVLMKQISKTISDFDTETGELLHLLYRQRDEQVFQYSVVFSILFPVLF